MPVRIKNNVKLLLLTLFLISGLEIKAQKIGVAAISGEAYRVPYTSLFKEGMKQSITLPPDSPSIPYFQEELQAELERMVPVWLRGIKKIRSIYPDVAQLTEAEQLNLIELNREVSEMVAFKDERAIDKDPNRYNQLKDMQLALSDRTRKLGRQLDCDHLLFIRVVATHKVRKKDIDLPVEEGRKINGVSSIVVVILNAADASMVAYDVKTLNDRQDGGYIGTDLDSRLLLKRSEVVLEKVCKSFLKAIK